MLAQKAPLTGGVRRHEHRRGPDTGSGPPRTGLLHQDGAELPGAGLLANDSRRLLPCSGRLRSLSRSAGRAGRLSFRWGGLIARRRSFTRRCRVSPGGRLRASERRPTRSCRKCSSGRHDLPFGELPSRLLFAILFVLTVAPPQDSSPNRCEPSRQRQTDENILAGAARASWRRSRASGRRSR